METNTARNFALQLGSLIALYVSISALIAVIFGVINVTYPDQAEGYWAYEGAQQGIRFGVAMLIVFFPTYLILTRFVNQIRRKETGTYLTLTKWLVYLSLLAGGAILLGDLVAVILAYLNGEITLRFILKALTLLVVIGTAFYYYILDARNFWNAHEKESKLYAGLASCVVIASLVLGFLNSETPKEVRNMKLDDQQLQDLQDMEWRINEFYSNKDVLPGSIEELYVGIPVPTAPEDRDAYEYKVVDEDTYELCATFTHSSQQGVSAARPMPAMMGDTAMKVPYNTWDHGEGKTCFERTAVDYTPNTAE